MGPMLIPPGHPADHNKDCVHLPGQGRVHPVLELCPQERPTFLRGPDPNLGPALGGQGGCLSTTGKEVSQEPGPSR